MPNIPKPEQSLKRSEDAQPLISEMVDAVAPAPLPEHHNVNRETGAGEVAVDPRTEYVAGNGFVNSLIAYAQSLPPWIDELSRDLGADIYDKMALDPHVAGETLVYTRSVLSGGVRLIPAFPKPPDSTDVDAERKHDIATKIRDFCQRCLDELDTPLHQVLQDMMWAFGQGYRVAEIVWRLDNHGYLMPFRLKVKSRDAIAFVTDNRSNVIGLLGAIAGQATIVVRPELVIRPGDVNNIIPRRKFMVQTWRPKGSDPRGTSGYRPAYNPWWQKRQTEAELAKYITQFAGAMLVGTTAEKAQEKAMVGPDGNPIIGPGGKPLMLSPADALLQVLTQLRNGGAAAIPYGADIKNLVTTGAGIPFFQQIERCDSDISKVILGTTLMSNESRHQSRAATGSHKDTTNLLMEEGEISLASMLTRDLLREAVRNNFGEEYLPFVPVASLSAAEEADVAELLKAFVTAGYAISPEHLATIDAMVNLPPRKDEGHSTGTGTVTKAVAGEPIKNPNSEEKTEKDTDEKSKG